MTYFNEPEKIPSKDYRQKIEKLAKQISDPVRKLRFLQRVLEDIYEEQCRRISEDLHQVPQKRGLISLLFRKAPKNQSDNRGMVARTSHLEANEKWYRHIFSLIVIAGIIVFCFKIAMFMSVNSPPPLPQIITHNRNHPKPDLTNYITPKVADTPPILPVLSFDRQKKPLGEKNVFPEYKETQIWLIEKTADSEYYSNGLRIYTNSTTDNIPRCYRNVPIDALEASDLGPETDKVVGILYHTTESDIYEFKPEMTQSIKDYSRRLINYLKKKRAYHYVINRFGRVYRLVREDHAAYHAGNSIWADSDNIYLDLNNAFIGVCFEGKDFKKNDRSKVESEKSASSAKIIPMERSSINEAQLRSGKALTDWLRVKYRIPQTNCVPHALVSVNPYDLLIGYHLDLSYDFPFDMFELSNKYDELIPAITQFGFSYNKYFLKVMKERVWPGIIISEKYLRQGAKQQKTSLKVYRKFLNDRFIKLFELQKAFEQSRESEDIVSSN